MTWNRVRLRPAVDRVLVPGLDDPGMDDPALSSPRNSKPRLCLDRRLAALRDDFAVARVDRARVDEAEDDAVTFLDPDEEAEERARLAGSTLRRDAGTSLPLVVRRFLLTVGPRSGP